MTHIERAATQSQIEDNVESLHSIVNSIYPQNVIAMSGNVVKMKVPHTNFYYYIPVCKKMPDFAMYP